jgi:8-oxo-dGTP pyrophosphatase MutT (NUDIX family)
LTVEELRRRFVASAAATPPAESIYGDEAERPDPALLKPAAVLVPVVARVPQATILFTRRATHLKDHSGQVSFPGGRVAPADASPEATALRETREEIGLDAARVELLGRLPEYITGTGFRITPVVGILAPPFDLQADANEVEEIFEVPLAFLLDPANRQRQSREWQGKTRWFFAMPYQEHYIWGATAGMLVNLANHLSAGKRQGRL